LDSMSFFWSFMKMLTTLSMVIGMMIGALYLMKKYFYRSPVATGSSGLIRVISSHHLGPKKSIMLVEVLGEIILLGVSDHQMSMLTTISDPGATEKLGNLQMKEGCSPVFDPLSRCKSLFRTMSHIRKDR